MNTEPQTINESSVFSSDVNSEIVSLQSRIDGLSELANRWNVWYLRFLAISILVAAGTVIFQYLAIKTSRLVSDKQSELLHLKDIKSANDSRDKDKRISDTNKLAGDANERAGIANRVAGEANERAGKFEAEAEKARADIARANESSAVASRRAAEATQAAEQEKIERLKLEAQIAPRRLSVNQQQAIASACSRFAGHKVTVVSYSLDTEGAVLAKQIIAALQSGSIMVDDRTASFMPLGGFVGGVLVRGGDKQFRDFLAGILSSIGKLATGSAEMRPTLPNVSTGPATEPTVVEILVGVKPPQ